MGMGGYPAAQMAQLRSPVHSQAMLIPGHPHAAMMMAHAASGHSSPAMHAAAAAAAAAGLASSHNSAASSASPLYDATGQPVMDIHAA